MNSGPHGCDLDREFELPPHCQFYPPAPLHMNYELSQGAINVDSYILPVCAATTDPARYLSPTGAQNTDPPRYVLPMHARVEVFPPDDETECMIIVTLNRRGHGQGGDGLTIYASVNRADFTFRSQVFAQFPQEIVRHNHVKLVPRQWNELAVSISEERATYWINDCRIATIKFNEGDLPTTAPHIGLVSYSSSYRARRFDVSRDPMFLEQLMTKVVTLHGLLREGDLCIACTSISGEQLAILPSARAHKLMCGTQIIVSDDCEGVALTYRDGARIPEYDPDAPTVRVARRTFGFVSDRFIDEEGRENAFVDFIDNAGTLWVQPECIGALSMRDSEEERLGDFRSRLAGVLGTMECDLKLALPDGVFLSEAADPLSLNTLRTVEWSNDFIPASATC